MGNQTQPSATKRNATSTPWCGLCVWYCVAFSFLLAVSRRVVFGGRRDDSSRESLPRRAPPPPIIKQKLQAALANSPARPLSAHTLLSSSLLLFCFVFCCCHFHPAASVRSAILRVGCCVTVSDDRAVTTKRCFGCDCCCGCLTRNNSCAPAYSTPAATSLLLVVV